MRAQHDVVLHKCDCVELPYLSACIPRNQGCGNFMATILHPGCFVDTSSAHMLPNITYPTSSAMAKLQGGCCAVRPRAPGCGLQFHHRQGYAMQLRLNPALLLQVVKAC